MIAATMIHALIINASILVLITLLVQKILFVYPIIIPQCAFALSKIPSIFQIAKRYQVKMIDRSYIAELHYGLSESWCGFQSFAMICIQKYFINIHQPHLETIDFIVGKYMETWHLQKKKIFYGNNQCGLYSTGPIVLQKPLQLHEHISFYKIHFGLAELHLISIQYFVLDLFIFLDSRVLFSVFVDSFRCSNYFFQFFFCIYFICK